jgi:hypothetical protein
MKTQSQLQENEFLTSLPIGPLGRKVQVLVQYRPSPKDITHNCIGHLIALETPDALFTSIREVVSGQEHDFAALPPNLQEQIRKHQQPHFDLT